MNTNIKESIFEGFFNQFGDLFKDPLKRALFLTGVMISVVNNVQFRKFGHEPFNSNLKGFKLNEKDVKELIVKIKEKLDIYDAWGSNSKKVYKEVCYYLLVAGDKWKMHMPEINYYIVTGIALGQDLYKKLQNEKHGGETNGNKE